MIGVLATLLWLLHILPMLNGEYESCHEKSRELTGSYPEEDPLFRPEIRIDFPKSASFYASPGQQYIQSVYVTNTGTESLNLILSFRENFVVDEIHVELVSMLEPTSVSGLAPNKTITVAVKFDIPDYVSVGSQGKVTILVQKVTLGASNGHDNFERAFVFTVSDGPLAKFDAGPPDCGQFVVCPDFAGCAETTPANCNETFWGAEMVTSDNVTGIRFVDLVRPDLVSMEWVRPLVVGSRREAHLRFVSQCCLQGFEVQVQDLARNVVECVVGIRSGANSKAAISLPLLLYLLTFIVAS